MTTGADAGPWAGRMEPVFATTAMDRTLAFWHALGFSSEVWEDGDFAIVRSGPRGAGLAIAYSVDEDFDPFGQFSTVYLTVADAALTHARVVASGVVLDAITDEGLFRYSLAELRERRAHGFPIARVTRLLDQEWGRREFALFDPDNNLVRVGSPI